MAGDFTDLRAARAAVKERDGKFSYLLCQDISLRSEIWVVRAGRARSHQVSVRGFE